MLYIWVMTLRKEGGRGLASIDVSLQRLKDYIKKAQRKTNYSDQKHCGQHDDQ